MKITKAQLQQIIKEETQALMSEKGLLGKAMGAIGKKAKSAASNIDRDWETFFTHQGLGFFFDDLL